MLIDPAIRDWVLLPLLSLVVVLHYLRLYVMRLTTSEPTPELAELRQRGVVARSVRLRTHGGAITGQGYAMRKERLLGADAGQLNDAGVVDKPPNPLAQPDMMKQQALGMVRVEGGGGGRWVRGRCMVVRGRCMGLWGRGMGVGGEAAVKRRRGRGEATRGGGEMEGARVLQA